MNEEVMGERIRYLHSKTIEEKISFLETGGWEEIHQWLESSKKGSSSLLQPVVALLKELPINYTSKKILNNSNSPILKSFEKIFDQCITKNDRIILTDLVKFWLGIVKDRMMYRRKASKASNRFDPEFEMITVFDDHHVIQFSPDFHKIWWKITTGGITKVFRIGEDFWLQLIGIPGLRLGTDSSLIHSEPSIKKNLDEVVLAVKKKLHEKKKVKLVDVLVSERKKLVACKHSPGGTDIIHNNGQLSSQCDTQQTHSNILKFQRDQHASGSNFFLPASSPLPNRILPESFPSYFQAPLFMGYYRERSDVLNTPSTLKNPCETIQAIPSNTMVQGGDKVQPWLLHQIILPEAVCQAGPTRVMTSHSFTFDWSFMGRPLPMIDWIDPWFIKDKITNSQKLENARKAPREEVRRTGGQEEKAHDRVSRQVDGNGKQSWRHRRDEKGRDLHGTRMLKREHERSNRDEEDGIKINHPNNHPNS